MDFRCSDEGIIRNCCRTPWLYGSTIAKTQDTKTGSPAERGKSKNIALTFSHSSLSYLLCCRRSGAPAPLQYQGYLHLLPAKKKKKEKQLKISLHARDCCLLSTSPCIFTYMCKHSWNLQCARSCTSAFLPRKTEPQDYDLVCDQLFRNHVAEPR